MAYPYFSDDVQLRRHLPATADLTLAKFQSYIDRARDQQVRRALGLQLLEYIEAGNAPEALLALLRPALASLAYHLYAPIGSVLLTSNGAAQFTSDTQKSATDKQVDRATNALEADGLAQLEAVLDYLELHVADFPEWANSPACTLLSGHFFRTATEFDNYVQIDNSRVHFKKLWPTIRTIELHFILPVLGRELQQRLLAELGNPAHVDVLDLVRTALANLTMPGDELRTHTAYTALAELDFYLQEHTEQYPEFLTSPAYRPPIEQPNQSDFGFFAFIP